MLCISIGTALAQRKPEYIEYNCTIDTISFMSHKSDYIDGIATLNLKYNDGIIYIRYDNIYSTYNYTWEPNFYFSDLKTLELNWKIGNPFPYTLPKTKISLTASTEFSGKIRFETSIFIDKEAPIVKEINTFEGMDLTFPIDTYHSYPTFAHEYIYLYGLEKNGKLTGQFASEVILPWVQMENGISYLPIARREYDCYDDFYSQEWSDTEIIGYIRFTDDCVKVLPVDKELDYANWTDAIQGSFNPYKIALGKEYSAYDFFPADGIVLFRDMMLDRFDISPIVETRDEWQEFNNIPECRQKYYNDASICRVNVLANGASMRGDIGFTGDCINSIIYPSMAGSDGARMKLIKAKTNIARPINEIYIDKRLNSLYEEYLADVENIVTEDNNIMYDGYDITYNSSTPTTMYIYALDGKLCVYISSAADIAYNTSELSTGTYIVKVINKNSYVAKRIFVK